MTCNIIMLVNVNKKKSVLYHKHKIYYIFLIKLIYYITHTFVNYIFDLIL